MRAWLILFVMLSACAHAAPVAQPAATVPTPTSTMPPTSTTLPTSTTPPTSTTVPPSNTVPAPASSQARPTPSLFDFADPAAAEAWRTIDDRVMGGVSASTAIWEKGALAFAGNVSLDNNGGFSSVLSASDPQLGQVAADAQGIGLRVRGDGKTYVLQVRLSDGRGDNYIVRFPTVAGEVSTYAFPIAAFEPVSFMLEPRVGAPALDPSAIAQFGFYILDKQAGPFRLDVQQIFVATPDDLSVPG